MCYLVEISQKYNIPYAFLSHRHILLGLKSSIKGRSSCQSQECCRAGTGNVDLGYEGISSATIQRYAEELIHCHHSQPSSPEQQRGECSR